MSRRQNESRDGYDPCPAEATRGGVELRDDVTLACRRHLECGSAGDILHQYSACMNRYRRLGILPGTGNWSAIQ
jgi:hypothetical protein